MPDLRLADDLALPPEAITETFGILAVRGAGKSNTAAVMAEEMFGAGLPFVVVDPVGSWFGLRSSRDGESTGLPIPIFGGRHGDVPLERSGGTVVADLVADQRLSCVLDLTGFDSEAGKKQFLLDFARRLYQRNEQPLHLFLEEADDYIPQRPMRDEAQLLRAWENIVRRGRARGLGMTLITQRSAALNKNVLTQVQTLIAMRTTGPQDRAAIEEWLRYHDQSREILASLPSLSTGEAWVWSPQFLQRTVRVRFRLRETFDSGATPKVTGNRPSATLADVDLGAVRQLMAETIERAKAEDPRELRRRIADLERQLQERPAPERIVERVEVPVIPADFLRRLDASLAPLATRLRSLSEIAEGFEHLRQVVREAGEIESQPQREAPQTSRSPAIQETRGTRAEPSPPHEQPAGGTPLAAPQRKILGALARLAATGIGRPSRQNVAALAGYSWRGGRFSNLLGELRSAGLIDYPSDGLVTLTSEGAAAVGSVEPIRSLSELHDAWRAILPRPEASLLNALIDVYPRALTREELADAAGYTASGGRFANMVGALRSFGVIDYPSPGQVVATSLLFPEGL